VGHILEPGLVAVKADCCASSGAVCWIGSKCSGLRTLVISALHGGRGICKKMYGDLDTQLDARISFSSFGVARASLFRGKRRGNTWSEFWEERRDETSGTIFFLETA